MMSLGLKVAATFGITAGATITVVEFALQAVAVPAGVTGSPLVDGLLGGGAVGAGLWLWLAKQVEKKADKGDVDRALDKVDKKLDLILSHMLGDK